MINNFKMPTNKTAADALISQMRKQRADLENKLANLQKDNLKVKEKYESLKEHLVRNQKVISETKQHILDLQTKESQVIQALPGLYNSRSAARRARLKLKAAANKSKK
jgi:chromosome segregation ATPase